MSVKSNFTESQNRIKDLVLENEELTQNVIGPLYQQFENFTKERELKTGTYQYKSYVSLTIKGCVRLCVCLSLTSPPNSLIGCQNKTFKCPQPLQYY